MVAIIPQWTARVTNTEVAGEDHLGVEGMAQSYQQYLIPGIISTTDHARYYSFYCWILYRYINQPDSPRTLEGFKNAFFKRHELAFIAACYSHHQEIGPLGGLIGSGVNSYKARRIWESGNPIPLDDHFGYFGHSQGGFGQYYRPAMQAMGLVAEPQSSRWVYCLTRRGEKLAQAFAAAIAATAYAEQLEQKGEVTSLGHDAAAEYGQYACLCETALAFGADRALLLEAFFRFDESNPQSPHTRRQRTLTLLLDLVQQSKGLPFRQTLRRVLYLGQFADNRSYQPEGFLADWYQHWRMVQVRHTYTATIQVLWAVFLDYLYEEQQTTFGTFMSWVEQFLPEDIASLSLAAYLDQLCKAVGLPPAWEESAALFPDACDSGTLLDEMSLLEQLFADAAAVSQVVPVTVRILAQYFLRHYVRSTHPDARWQEVAQQERLPINFFMQETHRHVQEKLSVTDWLAFLYRYFCLGQHEIIALQKLRQNTYNTFKFYYQDGTFAWANNPPDYRVPLRFPGLRLFNSLTILIDLGLVLEDANGFCTLTVEGRSYLSQAAEVNHDA